MTDLAIIGCGAWGMNYLRVFGEIPGTRVTLACDGSEERLRAVRERSESTATSTSWEQAVAESSIDAVVIATPASTHYEIARHCLALGKHVLVEKPLAATVEEAAALCRSADETDRVLMVGHTFLYNDGVRKMRELVQRPAFGKVYYLHATRTNMGPIRSDVNAVRDLATHDVAVFNHILGAMPLWVSAVGSRVLGMQPEDVAFSTLCYPNGVLASVHCSWLDPNKVREIVVVGSHQRIVFDDLNNLERVRVFEKGVTPAEMEADTFGEFRFLLRDGDIISPYIPATEPLRNLALHFLECVGGGTPPLTGGANGLDVVRVLAAIDHSIAQNGAPVMVE